MAPVYLIAADDILQVNEATDSVRAAARRAGFEERDLKTVERGFRWESLGSGADSLSLFARRRILELRLASPKPGEAGARAIRALAEDPDPDRLVIISISGRLDRQVARSVWAKTIEKLGVIVDIWPVGREDLPRWIANRAQGRGLKLTRAAAELLADRAEGNLLAADQELSKLALLGTEHEIDELTVVESVASSARYDVFRLSDAVVAGNVVRSLKILAAMKAEASPLPLIVWAIVRELTLLAQIKQGERVGESIDTVLARLHVWQSRRPLLKQAARKLTWARICALLAQAETVDRGVKGAANSPPWVLLTELVLGVVTSFSVPGRSSA
jgi:DNA polymerase-3 subunit delta